MIGAASVGMTDAPPGSAAAAADAEPDADLVRLARFTRRFTLCLTCLALAPPFFEVE